MVAVAAATQLKISLVMEEQQFARLLTKVLVFVGKGQDFCSIVVRGSFTCKHVVEDKRNPQPFDIYGVSFV